ncbi:hypothetical protein BP5796_08019 [Coleophoma crateriformis]|uniref:NmrA-like domain-containing protein n=1 Tax=Coleophoma crateriformis TaxID=565419 RepID=A0A3D8RD76_9HELO|nr:hypothetical protein BP5796_08019 [Coleophoma crateriformis]
MYALTATTGKIGGAVLNAILKYQLLSPSSLVICTSSDTTLPLWESLKSQGAQVRTFKHEDPSTMVVALQGCTKLFLVSTPDISMDYFDAPPGKGREASHFAALKAAKEAGVGHVFYTSLAFASGSGAGVMRAHFRTEEFLKGCGMKYTVMREGLYNESWPLYLGFYYGLKNEERGEVVIAGDGPISWTSIRDLGIATALVVSEASEKYVGKTFFLSGTETKTLKQIAEMVSSARGIEVRTKVVSVEEYCRYYIEGKGLDKGNVEWWSTTYPALQQKECWIKDPTFSELLASKGVKPIPVEETIKEMLS